jgi:F-box protein 21
MAHVSSPNQDVADIYIDVYGSSTKAVLSARDDIPQLLLQAGIAPASMLRYIAPCPAAPMLLRAARNILSSLRMLPLGPYDVSEADRQAAMYASYCVNILMTGDNQLIPHLVNSLSDFPLDLGPVLHDTFAPLLQARSAQVLTDSCKDAIAAEEEAATASNIRPGHINYFVGMIFEHARQGYIGCIKGWEVRHVSRLDWSSASADPHHCIAYVYGHRRLDSTNGCRCLASWATPAFLSRLSPHGTTREMQVLCCSLSNYHVQR